MQTPLKDIHVSPNECHEETNCNYIYSFSCRPTVARLCFSKSTNCDYRSNILSSTTLCDKRASPQNSCLGLALSGYKQQRSLNFNCITLTEHHNAAKVELRRSSCAI